jgi:hypothetical protein
LKVSDHATVRLKVAVITLIEPVPRTETLGEAVPVLVRSVLSLSRSILAQSDHCVGPSISQESCVSHLEADLDGGPSLSEERLSANRHLLIEIVA